MASKGSPHVSSSAASPVLLLALALSLAPLLGGAAACGEMVLGRLPPPDAGLPIVTPKPPEVEAWEPKSVDPAARITVVHTGDRFTYVGFTNGEIYFRATGATGPWTRLDSEQDVAGVGARTPRRAVTAILVSVYDEDPPPVFVGYAGRERDSGTPQSTLWVFVGNGEARFPQFAVSDVWSLSSPPFDPIQMVLVTANGVWATLNRGSSWNGSGSGTFAINLPVTVQAFAVGVDALGGRRLWVGTASGDVWYADDIDNTPSTSLHWLLAPFDGRIEQPVTSIAVNPLRPSDIWVTFAGLADNNVQISIDNGATWHSKHSGELPTRSVLVPTAALATVSLLPQFDFAYVTAIVPDGRGEVTASAFWTVGTSGAWRAQ